MSAPLAECSKCGFQWFNLRDHTLPGEMGVFCVDTDRRVTTWTGVWVCARPECGEVIDSLLVPLVPPSLEVVRHTEGETP